VAPFRWHIRGARVLEEIANSDRDVRDQFAGLIDRLQNNPRKGEGIAAVQDRPDGYFDAQFDRALVEYVVYVDPVPGIDLEHVHWFPRPTTAAKGPLPELPR